MWILLSTIGALFQSVTGAVNKRNLGVVKHGINFIALINYFTAGILLLMLSVFETHLVIPEIRNSMHFWEGILINVPLSVVAAIFGYKALQIGEYNYISPWLAFTSLFTIIPSFIFFREVPTLASTLGILIVIAGAVMMEYKKKRKDAMTKDEEVQHKNNRKALMYIIVVGICFSVTPIGMRMAVLESSGIFVASVVHLSMALTFIALIIFLDKKRFFAEFKSLHLSDKKIFASTALSAGLSMALANGSIYVAIGMAQAPLVMAVKRIAPMFSFFIGYLIFKETSHARRKLAATVLMVAGTILIAVFK